jgi:hypothetical protein
MWRLVFYSQVENTCMITSFHFDIIIIRRFLACLHHLRVVFCYLKKNHFSCNFYTSKFVQHPRCLRVFSWHVNQFFKILYLVGSISGRSSMCRRGRDRMVVGNWIHEDTVDVERILKYKNYNWSDFFSSNRTLHANDASMLKNALWL